MCCAHARTDTQPDTPTSEPAEGLEAAALRAQPGTASRSSTPVRTLPPRSRPAPPGAPRSTTRLAEMEAGRRTPSNRWRVRYGLMLGLERVLASPTPATAAGTDLRRHQIDALAGMLTELIAVEPARGRGERQRQRQRARGRAAEDEARARRGGRRLRRGRRRRRGGRRAGVHGRRSRRLAALPLPPPDRIREDDRRGRLRRVGAAPRRPDPHPPPPARLAVHARPDDRGLRRALHRRDRRAARSRSATTRSRSRPTPGSRATRPRSRAAPTSS